MKRLSLSLLLLAFFIPKQASANQAIPPLEIKSLTDDVYLHISYQNIEGFGLVSSNGLIVINNHDAFIVDTPWSERDTAQLLTWLQDKNLNLVGSLSTHSHEDRTAGISLLNNKGIRTYATQQTNEFLKIKQQAQAIHTLNTPQDTLLNDQIAVYYPGGGHAADNIVVWLPNENLLFGGCLVRSKQAKSLGYTGESKLTQWPLSIEKLLGKYPNVSQVVPGHGKVGGRELLTHTLALTRQSK
ncbi:subclass B1 metallo-beta-lactamase [Thalassotalea ganghwensis]